MKRLALIGGIGMITMSLVILLTIPLTWVPCLFLSPTLLSP